MGIQWDKSLGHMCISSMNVSFVTTTLLVDDKVRADPFCMNWFLSLRFVVGFRDLRNFVTCLPSSGRDTGTSVCIWTVRFTQHTGGNTTRTYSIRLPTTPSKPPTLPTATQNKTVFLHAPSIGHRNRHHCVPPCVIPDISLWRPFLFWRYWPTTQCHQIPVNTGRCSAEAVC